MYGLGNESLIYLSRAESNISPIRLWKMVGCGTTVEKSETKLFCIWIEFCSFEPLAFLIQEYCWKFRDNEPLKLNPAFYSEAFPCFFSRTADQHILGF